MFRQTLAVLLVGSQTLLVLEVTLCQPGYSCAIVKFIYVHLPLTSLKALVFEHDASLNIDAATMQSRDRSTS